MTATRSDLIVRAIAAREGRCTIDVLGRDLAGRGFPQREMLPALTIALLAGRIVAEPGDVVALADEEATP